jgi:hypothetical protein
VASCGSIPGHHYRHHHPKYSLHGGATKLDALPFVINFQFVRIIQMKLSSSCILVQTCLSYFCHLALLDYMHYMSHIRYVCVLLKD